jgi:hypothetical protein
VGVLVICVLVFSVFCIVCTVFFIVLFIYIYSYFFVSTSVVVVVVVVIIIIIIINSFTFLSEFCLKTVP